MAIECFHAIKFLKSLDYVSGRQAFQCSRKIPFNNNPDSFLSRAINFLELKNVDFDAVTQNSCHKLPPATDKYMTLHMGVPTMRIMEDICPPIPGRK